MKYEPIQQGTRFGRWITLEVQSTNGSYAKILCRCDCGNMKSVRVYHLHAGASQSCGCLRSETRRLQAGKPIAALLAKEKRSIDGSNISYIQLNGSPTARSKSGVRGVYLASRGRWRAVLHISGKTIFLGYFKTIEEATKARRAAELKYFKPILDAWVEREAVTCPPILVPVRELVEI